MVEFKEIKAKIDTRILDRAKEHNINIDDEFVNSALIKRVNEISVCKF